MLRPHDPIPRALAHLEGDGLLQDIKQELQLQQGSSVSRVGGQRKEPMLLAPRQQVLFKQPGELLQVGRRQGQCAAAIQHQVTWRPGETNHLTLASNVNPQQILTSVKLKLYI